MSSHTEVLIFWFDETPPRLHFTMDADFDRLVNDRFLQTYKQAVAGELSDWRSTPDGRLAEVIVLDQFARNMFRQSHWAFLYDPLALALAQEAVRSGHDMRLERNRRAFLYMPFMHSESAKVHAEAFPLFQSLGNPETLKFELAHKEIIDRFGRYPHRNSILGRLSTSEENEFLASHTGF